ncbi:MAG TPA: hypothetical protein VFG68_15410 [Fimbriiglobus sp.]|nr:hypothetical protein [Fimbriiglobus sp.]
MCRWIPVLLVAPLLTGCGTLANMDGRSFALMGPPDRPTRVFGGVANDIRWVGEQAERVVEPDDPWCIPISFASAGYFGLVDLPLSLVGDIVTLPKVVRGTSKPQPPTARPAESGLGSGSQERESP